MGTAVGDRRRRFRTVAAVLAILLLGGVAVALWPADGSESTASAHSSLPTTGTFTALTYNVAGLPAALSGSEPDINTSYISPLLNDYDLVLVQEDWINPVPPIAGLEVFHEVLAADAEHPYQSTPAVSPLGTNPDRPSALVADGLNRFSRFLFGDITRQMWPNCFGGLDTSDGGAGDCLSEKGFSVATTYVAPGVVIDVYNLHAEAGGTPLDEQYSAEDFAVLADFIADHSAGRAVLVGGDFNLHTDRSPDNAVFATFLTETGLTDTCQVVDCADDRDRIDKFVFRNGGGVTLEPLEHGFERDKFVRPTDGAPLSDHDALRVQFEWTLEAASFSGTVTDSDGEPVEGARVLAYGPAEGWYGSGITTTRADGTYDIVGLSPAAYTVLVVPPSGSGLARSWYQSVDQRAEATPVTVTLAANRDGIDVQLVPGAAVEGTVTRGDGTPIAGVRVFGYLPGDLWAGTTLGFTDGNGRFNITDVPAGTYQLRFIPPPGSGAAATWLGNAPNRSATAPLAAAAGGVYTGLDAVLPAAP